MAETIGKGVLQVGFDPKQVEQAGKEQLLPAAKRLATDFAGVFAAVKVAGFVRGGVEELKQAEAANAQLAAAIRSTGGAAGVTAAHADELAQSLLKLSGTDDEAVKSAEALLLQFSAIRNTDIDKTFDRTTVAALDLATRMGGDITGAAETLGRALQDPVQGMTRLRRAGIILTDAQQEQVKAFVASGQTAQAQGVILDQLEKQVGGSAAAFGQTLPGQVKIAQESLKNMKAELVAGLAPALTFGAHAVTFLTEEFDRLPAAVQATVGGLALTTAGVLSLAQPARDLVALWDRFRSGSVAAVTATAQLSNATNSAAAVSGLYQAKASGLSSSLGKAGVAGAAVLAVGALAMYADSLNKTTVSETELNAALSASAEGANNLLDNLQALAGPALGHFGGIGGGLYESYLKGLVEKGPAGIGVLKSYRDHLAATGQSTVLLDAILKQAASSQANLNTNLGLGNTALDENSGVTLTNAQAQQRLTAALQDQQTARQHQLDSTRAVFDAEQSFATAQKGVESAARGVTDAERGVADADRRVADSRRGAEDATRRLTDAQEALNKALQPANAEDLGKAQLDVSDAHFRVADAQSAVTAASKEAEKDRKDGKHTAAEVADADRKVEEAKNALQRAIFAETDAQDSLTKAQEKGTEQDAAVVAARRAVDDATRAVADANRGVEDSLRGVSDAQRHVTEAKDALNAAYLTEADSAAALADKQIQLHGGVVSTKDALLDQLKAFQDIAAHLEPGSAARTNLDAYIAHLFVLAGIFNATSPGSDFTVSIGAGKQARAEGGPVRSRSPYLVGERGPEMFVPDVAGRIVTNDELHQYQEHAAAGRGMNFAPGSIVNHITNPAQERASTSVSREMAILADKLALVG